MKNLFGTIALVTVCAMPGLTFAEGMDAAKMTCAEFAKMDKDGMKKAIEEMHMAGPDASMAMDDAMSEKAMTAITTHCDGKPDMMAMDAMMMK